MTTTHDVLSYDVAIVGGGPGGTSAAIVLAHAGISVAVFEKEEHPRFHIGESILPRNALVLKELGLEEALAEVPKVAKFGAEFGWGNDAKTMRFGFTDGLLPGFPIFNIERAPFDKMLIDQARKAGAAVFENTPVQRIVKLDDDGAELIVAGDRTVRAKMLIDASGHGTVVGRHLQTRRNFDDPELQKVAYFAHFTNVERCSETPGHPSLFMCDEGWFWLIAINDDVMSVGFVTRPKFAKEIDVAPDRLLQWAVARCPMVRQRMRHARGPMTNRVLADFSYTCKPFAGAGYFLVGDAACFLDPIFSTGVTLAMVGGQEAARLTIARLRGAMSSRKAATKYRRFVAGSTSVFWRLIRNYYKQSFRELFMEGRGPLRVHNAVISTLAGQVFPRPVWALRWRLRFFDLCVWAQKHFALTPHRPVFKLRDESPVPLSMANETSAVQSNEAASLIAV